jgi:hypothetical protein
VAVEVVADVVSGGGGADVVSGLVIADDEVVDGEVTTDPAGSLPTVSLEPAQDVAISRSTPREIMRRIAVTLPESRSYADER